MRKSFTIRVFCINFIFLAIPLLITSFIFFDQFYTRRMKMAREKLVESAQNISEAVVSLEPLPKTALDDIIYFLPNNIEGAKNAIQNLNTKSRTIFELLSTQEREGGVYDILSETHGQGTTFISGGNIEGVLQKGSASFIRWIELDGMQAPGLVYFVAKTVVKDGNKMGILIAGTNIQDKMTFIMKEHHMDHNDFAVLNKEGVFIASTHRKFDGQYLHPLGELTRYRLNGSGALGDIFLAEAHLKPAHARPSESSDFVYDDKTYLAYSVQPPNVDFSVIAFTRKKAIFVEAMSQFIWIYIIYAIVVIVGVVVAFFLSQWISKPMRQLTHVMGEANEGNLEARFESRPLGYEFNLLGSMFNKTLEALVENMKQEEDERVAKETYLKELNLGREVQQNLLNIQMSPNENVEAAAIYIQAENVGGDFYCVESHSEGKYWLAVGDAAGKGISSCLYALSARSLLRTQALLKDDIGKVLSDTNNAFLEQTEDSGMFVAVLMGQYNTATGEFCYFSCGHTPGLIKRKDGALETLAHSGMALGLLESTDYQVDRVNLEPGDTVIFFTKGLVEAINSKNQYFSERHVRELLQQRKWITAEEIAEGLKKEYHKFVESMQQEDEVVVVALKIKSK